MQQQTLAGDLHSEHSLAVRLCRLLHERVSTSRQQADLADEQVSSQPVHYISWTLDQMSNGYAATKSLTGPTSGEGKAESHMSLSVH